MKSPFEKRDLGGFKNRQGEGIYGKRYKNALRPPGNHFCGRQESLTVGKRALEKAPGGAQYSSQPHPFIQGSR
jgi:hypothetical protein